MPETATAPEVTVTSWWTNRRTGNREACEATCGGFTGIREESARTDWWVVPTTAKDVLLKLVGSADAFGEYVTSGRAQRDFGLIAAHGKGEHKDGRIRECARC